MGRITVEEAARMINDKEAPFTYGGALKFFINEYGLTAEEVLDAIKSYFRIYCGQETDNDEEKATDKTGFYIDFSENNNEEGE